MIIICCCFSQADTFLSRYASDEYTTIWTAIIGQYRCRLCSISTLLISPLDGTEDNVVLKQSPKTSTFCWAKVLINCGNCQKLHKRNFSNFGYWWMNEKRKDDNSKSHKKTDFCTDRKWRCWLISCLFFFLFMHRPNEVLKAALVVQHCIEKASTIHQKVPWKQV